MGESESTIRDQSPFAARPQGNEEDSTVDLVSGYRILAQHGATGPSHTAICLGKFDHDLTVLANPGNHGECIGESCPAMAELFRLVKYSNLPRICMPWYSDIPWSTPSNVHESPKKIRSDQVPISKLCMFSKYVGFHVTQGCKINKDGYPEVVDCFQLRFHPPSSAVLCVPKLPETGTQYFRFQSPWLSLI
jgi:hypothetical protein